MLDNKYTLEEKRPACVLVTQENDRYIERVEVSRQIDSETQDWRKYKDYVDFDYRSLRYENDPLANWIGRDRAIQYMGKEAIEKAESACIESLAKVKIKIDSAKNHPAYESMKRICDSDIQHYKADFTYHDCLQLAEHNKEDRFIWSVRSTGTRIYFKGFTDTSLYYDLKNSPETKYYFYDGKVLAMVDSANVGYKFNLL